MNIEDMRFFCAVFDASSVSEASRALHLSPQGVSKRLKKIESELGAELFTRTIHGLNPTEAGTKTHSTFSSILASYEELSIRLNALRATGQTVKLAVEFYNSNLIDLDNLSEFEAQSQLETAVHIEYLSNNDCYRLVSSGAVDVALINRPLTAKGNFTFHSLQKRTALIGLSAADELTTKETITLRDLANRSFLGIREADSTNRAIMNIFAAANVPIRLQTISYEPNSLLESIKSGQGFHVFPDSLAFRYREEHDVVARPFPSDESIFDIGLLVSDHTADNRGVREFVDFVLSEPVSILSTRA